MPSGRSPLRELGLDAIVTAQGAPPLNGVQFGLPHQPLVAVPFPEHRGDQAGLGIRRLDFDARLADALSRDPRIEFCQRTEVRDIREDPGGSTVSTTSGDVRARFVAVADGLFCEQATTVSRRSVTTMQRPKIRCFFNTMRYSKHLLKRARYHSA